jgi:predicted acyl esterase
VTRLTARPQAARIASLEWFLRRRNPSDKLWIGQWDHGIGCCPTQRGWQWTKALHAWFDKHLKQRDVDTGPPVEAFVNDAVSFEATIANQGAIYTSTSFPPKAAKAVSLYPHADGSMSGAPASGGAAAFAGNPLGYLGNDLTEGVEFSTDHATKDQLFVGMPKLRLAASVTVPRVHLIATLYDEDADGLRRRITQFAINPELRNGVKTAKVVVPAKRYVMHPPGWSMAHLLRKGHKLTLRITTSDDDKVPFFAVDPHITVFTGRSETMLQLPLIRSPKLYKDAFPLKRKSDTSATAS